MKKIIILISIPFLFVLSYYVVMSSVFGYSYWRPLGFPPQPAVEIVGYGYDHVVVSTSDKAYRCDIERYAGCLEWGEVDVVSVDVVSNVSKWDDDYSPYALFFIFPPFRKTIDYQERVGFLPLYMILADGSVWHHYEHDTHIYIGFINLAVPLGAIIVFLIGIVVSGVIFVISKRRQHKEMV